MQHDVIFACTKSTKYLFFKSSCLFSQQIQCLIGMYSEDQMIEVLNRAGFRRVILEHICGRHAPDSSDISYQVVSLELL
ncbi:hypothetical protein TMatcc_006196 [Talaromyces marneffei ATCC 18224]